jgi:formate hydrogenlyase subunit 3/multisubunit Na+/H+ antiporter MnhD subunit
VVSVFGLESAYLLVVFVSGNRTVSGRSTVGGSSTVKGSKPEPGLEYVVMVSVSTVALVLAFTLMQSYTVTRDAAMLRLIVPLLGIGFGILLAAFPLHYWAPPLYHRGTTQAIALVGAISTVQALGLLIQTLSRYPWLLLSNRGSDLLVLAGIASLVCCPLLSLWHRPLARSVAYLLAGNVGFIFVGLAIHSPSSISGAIWLCLTQAVAVLVVVIGLEALDASAYYSESDRGSLPPGLGVALVGLGVLAIVGVPVLGAFPGKWLLYNEAAAASPWLLAAMLAGSALTAAGLVRCLIVESRRRGTAETDGAGLAKPLARPQLAAAVAAALVAALVGLALYPDPLLTAIETAVERLSLVL